MKVRLLKYGIVDCPNCNGGGLVRKVVPESLFRARIKAGLSKEQVAVRLGVSSNYLHKIETGKRNCTPKIEAEYAKL